MTRIKLVVVLLAVVAVLVAGAAPSASAEVSRGSTIYCDLGALTHCRVVLTDTEQSNFNCSGKARDEIHCTVPDHPEIGDVEYYFMNTVTDTTSGVSADAYRHPDPRYMHRFKKCQKQNRLHKHNPKHHKPCKIKKWKFAW